MSKQHSKLKPDPDEVRERHLHRIELYEKHQRQKQREAAAAGKSVGIAGRIRGLMLAFARQLARLLPGDSTATSAAPRASAGKHAKPHPRRPKPKRKR